jgi:hypothetical protein
MHAADRADPEPKALACYGLWLPARARMLLRFADGRPVSPVTCAFLTWVAVPVHRFEAPRLAYAAMSAGPICSARTWAGVL